MNNFDLLIFDADHTLWDFDKAEKNAIVRIFEDLGIEFDQSLLDIYRKINFSLWKKFEKNEINQDGIKNERFRLFFEKMAVEADIECISQAYIVYLSEGNELLEGAYELITRLKADYKLALLTNGISSVQHPRYEKSRLFGQFDAFVVSGDLGISKPDKRIFDLVLDQCKTNDRKRVLMTGDSLTSDIAGGINAGIRTCWYNPELHENKTSFLPDFEISDISDLHDILSDSNPNNH